MKKSKIWLLLFGAFAVTAVVGGIFFATGYLNRQKANKAYEEMQAVVNSGIPEENQEAGLEGQKDGAWQKSEADGDALANESGAVRKMVLQQERKHLRQAQRKDLPSQLNGMRRQSFPAERETLFHQSQMLP